MPCEPLVSIPNESNKIVDALRVPLRTVTLWKVCRSADLEIGPLRARTVHVGPDVIEIAHGAAEAHISASASRLLGPVGVCCGRPGPPVIELVRFIGDLSAVKHRVNCWRVGRVGSARVVNQSLQFLDIRQAPIVMAKVVVGVGLLSEGQCILPTNRGTIV